MTIPVVVMGAAQSGAGKTVVTMALIAGLRRRGLKVQPFKVGPDYLDPSLLTWAAGRECRNLDGWMLPEPQLLELFHRASAGADIAVVEGVMGLFDGRIGDGNVASTADVARQLGAPVVLVLDVARSSRTAGPVAAGLAAGGTAIDVAGAILNRVASDRHLRACTEGLDASHVRCLGSLRRNSHLALPDRYLGLVSASESAPNSALRRHLAEAAGGIDLDTITRVARPATPPPHGWPGMFPERTMPARARIALALDRAFHFYYRDSLDLLDAWGADIVPFSPLSDEAVPSGADAIYLGGGYPELFAGQLAANRPMIRSLRAHHQRGTLIYAECGGALYTGRGIEDAEGRRHRLAGLWPGWSSLKRRRLSVGYREVRALAPNFLHPRELPAHEFHYSQIARSSRGLPPAWGVIDDGGRLEGYAAGRFTASYVHLHLGSQRGLATAFIDACLRV